MDEQWNSQEWLEKLRGSHGLAVQEEAHTCLGQYLFKVGYNYLLKRQIDVASLQHLSQVELAEDARDLVQDILEKMARDRFALLEKYHGKGRFQAWAAVVLRNHIADRLKLAEHRYYRADPDKINQRSDPKLSNSAIRDELASTLFECLEQLPEDKRTALIRRFVERESAKVVGASMNKSDNAINSLILRAKADMRSCLEGKGVGIRDLSAFAPD